MELTEKIKLTQYSHGAGCGCKIAPTVLDVILKDNETKEHFPNLLVGNNTRDDAAVYDLGNGMALISTTDFFMPIVDDPFQFGRIAATNAISDVYAMGGTPTLAIAILGWPVDKLAPEIAGQVVAGGRQACKDAGIPLAGGHSIDCPEPVFGLAVNGLVETKNIKQNNTAQEGDLLFLTKNIGVGIITTAQKNGLAAEDDIQRAIESMTTLNKIGAALGKLNCVHALTDVTGFGLLGHLIEMAEGSGLTANINLSQVSLLQNIEKYLQQNCVPGGTKRNWKSYGLKVNPISERSINILCDPQTSGGLLVAVAPADVEEFKTIMQQHDLGAMCVQPLGRLVEKGNVVVTVVEKF